MTSATAKNSVPRIPLLFKIHFLGNFRHCSAQQRWRREYPVTSLYASDTPNVSCLNAPPLAPIAQPPGLSLPRQKALGEIEPFLHVGYLLTQRVQLVQHVTLGFLDLAYHFSRRTWCRAFYAVGDGAPNG